MKKPRNGMESVLDSIKACKNYLNLTHGNGQRMYFNLAIALICLSVEWAFFLDLATIIVRNAYGVVPAEREVERYLLAGIGMIAMAAVHFGFRHLYRDVQILVQMFIAVLAAIFIVNLSNIQNARYIRVISEHILSSETPQDALSFLTNPEVAATENRRIAEADEKAESAYAEIGLSREGLISRLRWFSLAFVLCSFVSLFCLEKFLRYWAINRKRGIAKRHLRHYAEWQNAQAEIERIENIKDTLNDESFRRSCVRTLQVHIVQRYIHGLRFLNMLLNEHQAFFIKSQDYSWSLQLVRRFFITALNPAITEEKIKAAEESVTRLKFVKIDAPEIPLVLGGNGNGHQTESLIVKNQKRTEENS